MTLQKTVWLTLLVAAAVFYWRVDPSVYALFPRCFLYSATGYQCPGCGLQRFLHAFLHLRLADAWHYHAWAFLLVCVSAPAVSLRFLFPRHYTRTVKERELYILIFVTTIIFTGTVIFTIARNL